MPDNRQDDRRRLAVIGAGVIGAGLATLAIGRGLDVLLVDTGEQARESAAARVRQQFRLARLTGALPRGGPTGTVTVGARVEDVAGATWVVESVPERPSVKRAVLAEAAAVVEPGTMVATTTSGIPVNELADALCRPAELLGLHFMNPPVSIRVVEVVHGPRTGERTARAAAALLGELGCRSLLVGDGPGFVVNRVLQRMINECSRIVADGLAAPETVDAAFTDCLGHRVGPLATADLIGLDNVVDSLLVLHERTGDPGYLPSATLLALVRAGDLGRKTGRGFFAYPRGS